MKKLLASLLILIFLSLCIPSSFADSTVVSCTIQIYGLVNQQNTGKNTTKAYIQAKASDGTVKTYTLDKNGYYEISDLKDGCYTIQAISKNKTHFNDSLALSITVNQGKSTRNRIYFTLPKVKQDGYSCKGLWPYGKQLVGRVDGPPAVLFEGYVLISDGHCFSKKAKVDETDQYFFIGLKDGKYTIKVVPAKNLYLVDGKTKTVTVKNGVCTPNRFDFAYSSSTQINYINELRTKAAAPKGQVYVPRGLRPDGIQLAGWMKGRQGTLFKGHIEILGRYGSYRTTIDSEGKFNIKGLANGKYYVNVISEDKEFYCTTKPMLITVEDGICTPNGIVPEYASVVG
jgi:hypothetical protein